LPSASFTKTSHWTDSTFYKPIERKQSFAIAIAPDGIIRAQSSRIPPLKVPAWMMSSTRRNVVHCSGSRLLGFLLNPVAAGLLGTQLVGEPITLNLIFGMVAVFAGIWIATTEPRKPYHSA
jgi:hypothetical protein